MLWCDRESALGSKKCKACSVSKVSRIPNKQDFLQRMDSTGLSHGSRAKEK